MKEFSKKRLKEGGGGSFFVPSPPTLQRRASWQMAVQEKDRKADHQHTTAAAAALEDKADTWLNAPKAQSRVKVRVVVVVGGKKILTRMLRLITCADGGVLHIHGFLMKGKSNRPYSISIVNQNRIHTSHGKRGRASEFAVFGGKRLITFHSSLLSPLTGYTHM